MSTLRVERVIQCPFSTTMHRITEYIDANHGVLPLTLPARAFGIPSLFAVRRDVVVRFFVTRDATSTQRTFEAIAISWSPEEGGRFPAFTGLITARPHSNGVLVTLDGRYTPPFHWFGMMFDRAFGHRAAIACCDALLADIQRALENFDLRERDLFAFATQNANIHQAQIGEGNVPLHGTASIRHDGKFLAVHITFDGRWDAAGLDRIPSEEYRLDESRSRPILAAVFDALSSSKNESKTKSPS